MNTPASANTILGRYQHANNKVLIYMNRVKPKGSISLPIHCVKSPNIGIKPFQSYKL